MHKIGISNPQLIPRFPNYPRMYWNQYKVVDKSSLTLQLDTGDWTLIWMRKEIAKRHGKHILDKEICCQFKILEIGGQSRWEGLRNTFSISIKYCKLQKAVRNNEPRNPIRFCPKQWLMNKTKGLMTIVGLFRILQLRPYFRGGGWTMEQN